MPLKPNALDLCLELDPSDTGYQAAIVWLQKQKDREDVGLDDITDEDRDAFYKHYLEQYFSVVSAAIKKYDPNHLYIGIA